MFPIYERDKRNNDRKRCRSFAAFLVLIVTLVSVAFLIPQSYAAEDDSNRAPHVVDWGLFDEETGTQTSLMDSGVIEGAAPGMVFYIKFDHNVAQMDGINNVGEQNCSLVSVVSNGGKPVASIAWVKDTQLEFQYRQCIFVTVTGTFDPSKYYHIAVAPGITAKNGFTNNGGTNLYFSFPTSGMGDEPVPMEEPVGNQDNKAGEATTGNEKTENEKTPETDPKQSTTSGNSTGSGHSQGSRRHNSGPVTANRPTTGNNTQMPLQQKPNTALEIYRLDAGIFENAADETAAEDQEADDFTDTEEMDARSTVAFSVLIALCILMMGAGAVCESILFRRRLRRR